MPRIKSQEYYLLKPVYLVSNNSAAIVMKKMESTQESR